MCEEMNDRSQIIFTKDFAGPEGYRWFIQIEEILVHQEEKKKNLTRKPVGPDGAVEWILRECVRQ